MESPKLEPKRIIDLLPFQLKNFPKDAAFSDKITGKWRKYSTLQAKSIVDKLSLAFIKLGIKPGDTIALISRNRVEWNFIDLAVLQVGALLVPLYPNNSEDNYCYIFDDANIKLAFAENYEILKKVKNVRKRTTAQIQEIFSINNIKNNHNWSELLDLADESNRNELNLRISNVKESGIATVIYTSGTTGIPKGVMLTHKNIMSNVYALTQLFPVHLYKRTISFLPLCHIFEKSAVYFYMLIGAEINYPESLETIGENIKEVKPNFFVTVPRLLEKVFEKIMAAGRDLNFIKLAIFGWAVNLANHFDLEGKNNLFYNVRLFFARKIVFVKWQEALGGEVKGIVSGSAALQPRLARIFTAAGMPVIEGYGLTETSPVLTCNRFEKGRFYIGTAGKCIPGVSIKLSGENEILAKGPNVMLGYYRNNEATLHAIDSEGWFHTGDIGEIVNDGYLRIKGRLSDIFKTSGGKFVAPQLIENKMKESFFIEHIMVIGENRKFTAAIIQPKFDFIKKWAEKKNLPLNSPNEIVQSDEVKKRIWKEVQKYNKGFGHIEQIKKIALVSDLWSVETGELTPTMKVKRRFLIEKYRDQMEHIYNAPGITNIL
ncbi:MAG: long-chain fatty acid--CoA ligase [Ignavibacteriaceae bacterium]|nr:long-chain fatty acid--CoA ligase [Ignavibacteriaceae bacterium]